MPLVNIDSILEHLSDWDLKLTVAGKTFDVHPPSLATVALIQKVGDGQVVVKDVRERLIEALTPLVDPQSGASPSSWSIAQLIAATTAILQHVKETAGKNLAGVGEAVKAAMRPAIPPTPVAAEIPARIPPAGAAPTPLPPLRTKS